MTIRKLTSSDIFPICTIIKKIGFEEIKTIINSKEIMAMVNGDNKDVNKVGMMFMLDMGNLIISNLPKCEEDLYKFLSSVANEEIETLRNISPAEFLELIINLIKSEDFKDFFGVVLRFLKLEK